MAGDLDWTFLALSSTNSLGKGIDLRSVSGTFTANRVTVVNPEKEGVRIRDARGFNMVVSGMHLKETELASLLCTNITGSLTLANLVIKDHKDTGISIDRFTGTIDFAQVDISNPLVSTNAIAIQRSNGSITFSGEISGSHTGIFLADNDASITIVDSFFEDLLLGVVSSNSVDLAIIRSTINAHDAAVDINLSGPLTNNVSELELKYLASQLNGEMRHTLSNEGRRTRRLLLDVHQPSARWTKRNSLRRTAQRYRWIYRYGYHERDRRFLYSTSARR